MPFSILVLKMDRDTRLEWPEYLCENEQNFGISLGCCSGAYVLLIPEKNQSSKISCYCPFKSSVTSGGIHHCKKLRLLRETQCYHEYPFM